MVAGLVIDVNLDGMPLNMSLGGLTVLTADIDGWYDTPDVEPRDAERILSDGGIVGPKTTHAREITISGSVTADTRPGLFAVRDQLALRMTRRDLMDLIVGDLLTGLTLTAQVRGISPLTWRPVGPNAAYYSLTLRAADPRRYAVNWQTELIRLGAASLDTGRLYPRLYNEPDEDEERSGWWYRSPIAPGTGRLRNEGNAPPPVYATYFGPLAETRLRDGRGNQLRVAQLFAGEQITVDTMTMSAWTGNGISRARYILPGSTPLMLPPFSTVTWHVSGVGSGYVELEWRSAWS